MSMISSQVGELRFMAHMLDTDGHPSFAREVRRAADTIWELRNKLAGTVDQSEEISKRTAELDFQIADNWRLTVVSESLKEQNAKLREIVRDMRKALFALDIDHCQACPRDTINGPCTKHLIGGSNECNFEEELRELGIEVKDD